LNVGVVERKGNSAIFFRKKEHGGIKLFGSKNAYGTQFVKRQRTLRDSRGRPIKVEEASGEGASKVNPSDESASEVSNSDVRTFEESPSSPLLVLLNSGDLTALQELPGVGIKRAKKIIAARGEIKFSNTGELEKVEGLSKKAIAKIIGHFKE